MNKYRQNGSSRRRKQNNVSPGRVHLEAMKKLDGLVRVLEEQIALDNDMLTNKAVHYKDMPVQTSGAKDQIGETVPDIVDTESQIKEYIQRLQKRKSETLNLIQVMDEEQQKLIMLYFMQNKTLEQIAEEMGRSYKWTWMKLHEAIKEFEILYASWQQD